jgi:hypothetical protein
VPLLALSKSCAAEPSNEARRIAFIFGDMQKRILQPWEFAFPSFPFLGRSSGLSSFDS